MIWGSRGWVVRRGGLEWICGGSFAVSASFFFFPPPSLFPQNFAIYSRTTSGKAVAEADDEGLYFLFFLPTLQYFKYFDITGLSSLFHRWWYFWRNVLLSVPQFLTAAAEAVWNFFLGQRKKRELFWYPHRSLPFSSSCLLSLVGQGKEEEGKKQQGGGDPRPDQVREIKKAILFGHTVYSTCAQI